MTLQTQQQADLYWSTREQKKYVVGLQSGPRYARKSETLVVTARTKAGAIKTAKEIASVLMKHANATARLATAQDLGCVATGETQ